MGRARPVGAHPRPRPQVHPSLRRRLHCHRDGDPDHPPHRALSQAAPLRPHPDPTQLDPFASPAETGSAASCRSTRRSLSVLSSGRPQAHRRARRRPAGSARRGGLIRWLVSADCPRRRGGFRSPSIQRLGRDGGKPDHSAMAGRSAPSRESSTCCRRRRARRRSRRATGTARSSP